MRRSIPPAPEGAQLLHEEYRLGDYRRSFILSDEVDRDRIAAELNNGVLTLLLPKAERADAPHRDQVIAWRRNPYRIGAYHASTQ